jgi:hypothetical protein
MSFSANALECLRIVPSEWRRQGAWLQGIGEDRQQEREAGCCQHDVEVQVSGCLGDARDGSSDGGDGPGYGQSAEPGEDGRRHVA